MNPAIFASYRQRILISGGSNNLYPNIIGVNTTADGKQVTAEIGDSNTDGRSLAIKTIAGNTLFNRNGSSWDEITNQSISNSGTHGNLAHQFAETYKADTGFITYMVNGGEGGSALFPTTELSEHWMGATAPTGIDLLTPYLVRLESALASLGLTKPKVFLINGLGINDYNGGRTAEQVAQGLDGLVTTLTTLYPGVPILYTTTGVDNFTTDLFADLLYEIRNVQIQKHRNTTDFHIVGSGAALVSPNFYEADELHYNLDGLNYVGNCYAKWLKNVSLVSNKTARSIISSHFDELSLERKQVIDTAFIMFGDQYWNTEAWYRCVESTENNIYLDWTFLGQFRKIGSPVFLADNYIQTTGLNAANRWVYPSWDGANMRAASKDDFIEGVKLITNGSGTGSNQNLFGTNSSGVGGRYVEDSNANTIRYAANDNSLTIGVSTAKLEDNSLHSIARLGGDKILLRDTTVRNTTSLAVVETVGSRMSSVGARDTTVPFDGTYGYVYKAKYSSFDLALFIEVNDYITANW